VEARLDRADLEVEPHGTPRSWLVRRGIRKTGQKARWVGEKMRECGVGARRGCCAGAGGVQIAWNSKLARIGDGIRWYQRDRAIFWMRARLAGLMMGEW
jgi:hypothetical protein